MPAYLVQRPTSTGQTFVDKANAVVLFANSVNDAKALAKARYTGDGDAAWTGATVTEIVAGSTLAGWRMRARVIDASPVIDLEATIAATDLAVSAVAIAAGGTGYAAANILTVTGGTATRAARLEVTSVATGVIDGIKVIDPGEYTVLPADPAAVTGGGGTGATFNLTTATATLDVLAAKMVGLLNATAINGASYEPAAGVRLLTLASVADNIGDKTAQVEVIAPANGFPGAASAPVPDFVGAITDQGAAGAALTAVLGAAAVAVPAFYAGVETR